MNPEQRDRFNALVEFLRRDERDDDATWHWKQEQKAARMAIDPVQFRDAAFGDCSSQ